MAAVSLFTAPVVLSQAVKNNLQLFAEVETVDLEQTKSDPMDISNVNAVSLFLSNSFNKFSHVFLSMFSIFAL